MARFYINGGKKGAGWIGGVQFIKPTEYETDDPTMIKALRNGGSVVSELVDDPIEDTEPANSDPISFADMSHAELKSVCKERGLPIKRSKVEMIEQLEIDEE